MSKTILNPKGRCFIAKWYCNNYGGALYFENMTGPDEAAMEAKRLYKQTHHKRNDAKPFTLLKCVDSCNLKMEIIDVTGATYETIAKIIKGEINEAFENNENSPA